MSEKKCHVRRKSPSLQNFCQHCKRRTWIQWPGTICDHRAFSISFPPKRSDSFPAREILKNFQTPSRKRSAKKATSSTIAALLVNVENIKEEARYPQDEDRFWWSASGGGWDVAGNPASEVQPQAQEEIYRGTPDETEQTRNLRQIGKASASKILLRNSRIKEGSLSRSEICRFGEWKHACSNGNLKTNAANIEEAHVPAQVAVSASSEKTADEIPPASTDSMLRKVKNILFGIKNSDLQTACRPEAQKNPA